MRPFANPAEEREHRELDRIEAKLNAHETARLSLITFIGEPRITARLVEDRTRSRVVPLEKLGANLNAASVPRLDVFRFRVTKDK